MKTIQLILVGLFLAVFHINAQPDLSILTNHAALVGHVFKQVEGVMVGFHAHASAQDFNPSIFYPYTNSVKTLEDIKAMVTNQWWALKVVDTNAPISISVQFLNTSDERIARGYGEYNQKGGSLSRTLFEGYNQGVPQRSPDSSKWALPDYAQEIQMRLTYNTFIPMTNIASAHFVYTNQWGGYNSSDLPIDYEQGFWFYPEFAGQGILILGAWVRGTDGMLRFKEIAYNLAAGGSEVPITGVLVRALIEDSDDFRSSVNSTNLDTSVYESDGYGKVPLLMATYTADAPAVYLSVHTHTARQHATSFVLENQATGVRTMISVPANAIGLNVSIPKGVYHIIPQGLNLKASWYGGGGKG